jgi:hypothetical protein
MLLRTVPPAISRSRMNGVALFTLLLTPLQYFFLTRNLVGQKRNPAAVMDRRDSHQLTWARLLPSARTRSNQVWTVCPATSTRTWSPGRVGKQSTYRTGLGKLRSIPRVSSALDATVGPENWTPIVRGATCRRCPDLQPMVVISKRAPRLPTGRIAGRVQETSTLSVVRLSWLLSKVVNSG